MRERFKWPFWDVILSPSQHLFLFLLVKSPLILQAVTDNISVLGYSLEGVRSFHLSYQLRLIQLTYPFSF